MGSELFICSEKHPAFPYSVLIESCHCPSYPISFVTGIQVDLYQQILMRYWGHPKFRPLQEDIIKSVSAEKDTLGLMPTGGGKSVTFQIPSLAKDGICIVVTPLISLMKDQVENLKGKDIKAAAVYSGMSRSEIDITLDNCIYGDYKFLYVSPERISTELFRIRAAKMNVNLITVDEAHCISQWGYDFRPSYLKIAGLRDLHPEVPILALTATATEDILDDIQEKLGFRSKHVLRTSFERKNLIYKVLDIEDKLKQLTRLVAGIRGSGIVYVRTRKHAREVAEELARQKISATYYHAGLDYHVRESRQEDWMAGKYRIIVATNAFGMGIDKADVRLVAHYDIPDSVESYFQESGRAGRDDKPAESILLINRSDRSRMDKRVLVKFPELKAIKNIYEALGNYFQIPVGGGKNMVFDFNIADFSSRYKMNLLVVYNSLKTLEREGYIELTEEIKNPSRVHFLIERDGLYRFQVANKSFDGFIKLLLRSYTGVFTEYVNINESFLARKAKISEEVVKQYLEKLSSLKIIQFIPQKKSPYLIFTEERLDKKNLIISHENYVKRKEGFILRQDRIWQYATSQAKCRSQFLLEYFGDHESLRCGQCDVCTKRNELDMSAYEFDLILDQIKDTLKKEAIPLETLVVKSGMAEEKVLKVIRFLIDNDKIKYSENQKLTWTKPFQNT